MLALLLGVTIVLSLSTVHAQEISIKSNESVEIGTVYWISKCKSLLKNFSGVDVLEGLSGITLTIKEEMVIAWRQSCPDKVPGGKVIATVKEIKTEVSGVVKYRVRYQTADGDKESTHSLILTLYP